MGCENSILSGVMSWGSVAKPELIYLLFENISLYFIETPVPLFAAALSRDAMNGVSTKGLAPSGLFCNACIPWQHFSEP